MRGCLLVGGPGAVFVSLTEWAAREKLSAERVLCALTNVQMAKADRVVCSQMIA